ncbi:phosphatidate cytidylyltransferase [Microbacterium sp. STN6]|uniref:phosphatidate cytidylyltransferase n=1 Tax=Microbacterium sp. STN6 TaxID=2995588 RepID=UPI0022609320|nr:phosphatidate cytidylyltransferase [Microbacterium sp. STN6]MCX7522135.1 phosphatidate cytidylyltransferase [Microbacterium sp. STN6]
MQQDPSDHEPQAGGPSRRRHERGDLGASMKATRQDFERQVKATRGDIERQMQATKAQFDATSERIQARTGRNLILAILIGVGLGLLIVASLIIVKELFLVLGLALLGFASFELAGALRGAGWLVPRIPTVVSALAVVPATYYGGSTGQLVSVGAGIVFVSLWRLAELTMRSHRASAASVMRDLGAGVLIQIYVVFLGSFAILLLAQEHGQWWLLGSLIVVVAVDTGAYVSGLLFGKHPMAPVISPKKTWEGFAGAAVASIIAGILLATLMMGEPVWFGFILGPVLLLTATMGDLAESLIKRDLGIKDMSSWLPGHGGFLDRLDSILPSAAAAFALFVVFAGLKV